MGKGKQMKKSAKSATNPWDVERGSETTVVLTGIPKTLNAEILLGLLDSNFWSCYDYFYLPMDMDRFESTGLAYINFRSHETAVECQRFFTGFTEWPGNHWSERTCKAQWSSIQGFDANIEKQQKLQDWVSCNVPEDCKPMVFDEHGTRLPTLDVFPVLEDGWSGDKWTGEWYGGSSKSQHSDATYEQADGWSDWSVWQSGRWPKDGWKSWSYDRDSWSKWGATWKGQQEPSDWTWQPDLWKGKEQSDEENEESKYEKEWSNEWSNEWSSEWPEEPAERVERVEVLELFPRLVEEMPSETAHPTEPVEPHVEHHVEPPVEPHVDVEPLVEPPVEPVVEPHVQLLVDGASTKVQDGPKVEGLSLGLARYACPGCRSCFAKWSACQHHISSDAKCRNVTAHMEDLQAACRQQAEELPTEDRMPRPPSPEDVMRRFQ